MTKYFLVIFIFIFSVVNSARDKKAAEAAAKTSCLLQTFNDSFIPSLDSCSGLSIQNEDNYQFITCCYEKSTTGTIIAIGCDPMTQSEYDNYKSQSRAKFMEQVWAGDGETINDLICQSPADAAEEIAAKKTDCYTKSRSGTITQDYCKSLATGTEFAACCYEKYNQNGKEITDCYPVSKDDLNTYNSDKQKFINLWTNYTETYSDVVCTYSASTTTEAAAAVKTDCYTKSRNGTITEDYCKSLATGTVNGYEFVACCYEKYTNANKETITDCYPIERKDYDDYKEKERSKFIQESWGNSGETYTSLICNTNTKLVSSAKYISLGLISLILFLF